MDNKTTPTRPPEYGGATCSIEHRALLWDAINQYVEACGGEPHRHVYGNTRRQRCVVAIEKLVYQSNDKAETSERSEV